MLGNCCTFAIIQQTVSHLCDPLTLYTTENKKNQQTVQAGLQKLINRYVRGSSRCNLHQSDQTISLTAKMRTSLSESGIKGW